MPSPPSPATLAWRRSSTRPWMPASRWRPSTRETATKNKRLFFVGADLYMQGEAAGEAMAQAIGGKGKVAIITGFFAVEAHELRRTGFEDCMEKKYPDVEVVGAVENNDKGDVAYTQAQDFMTANPDLAGIYVTAGGPFGAGQAVEDAGKTGKVQVVSFDFVDETMQLRQERRDLRHDRPGSVRPGSRPGDPPVQLPGRR